MHRTHRGPSYQLIGCGSIVNPPGRVSRNFLITLALGMTFGFCFAYMLLYTTTTGTGRSLTEYDASGLGNMFQSRFSALTTDQSQQPGADHGHKHDDDGHEHGHNHHDAHSEDELSDVAGPAEPVSFHSHHELAHKG